MTLLDLFIRVQQHLNIRIKKIKKIKTSQRLAISHTFYTSTNSLVCHHTMEKIDLAMVDEKVAESLKSNDIASSEISQTIFIDPAAEKSVMSKFDKYILPQAFIFILLNYLDRSNLGMNIPPTPSNFVTL